VASDTPLLDRAIALLQDRDAFDVDAVRKTARLYNQASGLERQRIGQLLETWHSLATGDQVAWLHGYLDQVLD
jgi:hypothetical protein